MVPGKDFVTLWGEGDDDYFYLPEEKNEAVDTFKLIITTEPVDDFLLAEDELHLGEIVFLECARPSKIPAKEKFNDWFTRTLTIKTVRK